MNKSLLNTIQKRARGAIDGSEMTINRFARFITGTNSSLVKGLPDKQKLKKARKFARNFGGGRSEKINKILLGSALMLPLIMSGVMAKSQSTEDILQTQYGGNEKAMRADLKEEADARDEGLDRVNKAADENKDIDMDKQSDLRAIKKPESNLKDTEAAKPEEEEDTLTKSMRGQEDASDGFISLELAERFNALMDRFKFIARQSDVFDEPKKKNFRALDLLGGKEGDGYLGPPWMGIKLYDKEEEKKEDGEEVSVVNTNQTTINEVEINYVYPDGETVVKPQETILGDPPNLVSPKGESLNLTDKQYEFLAYAITGEAKLGTDDMYGVAASILNRVARGDEGGDIEKIIKADGQYEGYSKDMMYHDPELVKHLKTKEGQAKIIQALKTLEGRTDFKGQSQLSNRVPDEDPMFHPEGNFFHYSYQTSSDSVKPMDFKIPTFEQFINSDVDLMSIMKGEDPKLMSLVPDECLPYEDPIPMETNRFIPMPTPLKGTATSDLGGGGGDGGVIMIPTGKSMSSHLASLQLQSLYAS